MFDTCFLCRVSEIVIGPPEASVTDEEAAAAISGLTFAYSATTDTKTPYNAPKSAAGLPPSLLLPMGEVTDALVAGHAEVRDVKAPYTVYVVLVARVSAGKSGRSTNTPAAWTVFRRYRDFLGLYEALRKKGIAVPATFPGKRWLMQADDEFLAKRQAGLSVCGMKLSLNGL